MAAPTAPTAPAPAPDTEEEARSDGPAFKEKNWEINENQHEVIRLDDSLQVGETGFL